MARKLSIKKTMMQKSSSPMPPNRLKTERPVFGTMPTSSTPTTVIMSFAALKEHSRI